MKLNLTPEQIKNLNPTILDNMAFCERESKAHGGEAEVYYVQPFMAYNGKLANRYAIIEKTPNQFAGTDYFAGIWTDNSKGMEGQIDLAENLEKARASVEKYITKKTANKGIEK